MRVTSALLHIRAPKPLEGRSILKIVNGTFYRQHPTTQEGNPPLFPDLNFSVRDRASEEYWAIIGPPNAGKTTFLEILAGRHISVPPLALTYPNAEDDRRHPPAFSSRAIGYVGFSSRDKSLGGVDTKGAYLSARYESRREDTDFTLVDYLTGNTNLNPDYLASLGVRRLQKHGWLTRVVTALGLTEFLDMPVGNLSNGQTRRAKIAKAYASQPRLLLLDEPFLGLDPMTRKSLSHMLYSLSRRAGPAIVIALQESDEIPRWVSHVLYLGDDHTILAQGLKYTALQKVWASGRQIKAPKFGAKRIQKEASLGVASDEEFEISNSEAQHESPVRSHERSLRVALWAGITDMSPEVHSLEQANREILVEMSGVQVKYGEGSRTVIGKGSQTVDGAERSGFWWNVRRGDRWGLFGPNGSGKTTLLSLITSDHPQAYSLPIKLFGRSRLPTPTQPGISVFDIQARIGHSSPEIHNFFPKQLSIRQTVENAWADTFLSKPMLNHDNDTTIDAVLRWFKQELDPSHTGPDPVDELTSKYNSDQDHSFDWARKDTVRVLTNYLEIDIEWADTVLFGEVSFAAQRVALFLRAIVKKPDLVILDEAFSGMDELTKAKCMMFLARGEESWLSPVKRSGFLGRAIRRTQLHQFGKSLVTGLEPRQALINISHRQEEVPPIISQWICLPESNTMQPPRFGTLNLHERGAWQKSGWWDKIWNGSDTSSPDLKAKPKTLA